MDQECLNGEGARYSRFLNKDGDVKRKLNEDEKSLSATVAQDVSRRCREDEID